MQFSEQKRYRKRNFSRFFALVMVKNNDGAKKIDKNPVIKKVKARSH